MGSSCDLGSNNEGRGILSIPQPRARSVLHGKHKSTCRLTVSRLRNRLVVYGAAAPGLLAGMPLAAQP
jgi:hypothetical protein